MVSRGVLIAVFSALFVPTASAATLTIDSAMTVYGTDVFSGSSFVVSGAFSADDLFGLTVSGTVDLDAGGFTANAAGVLTEHNTINTTGVVGGTTLCPNSLVSCAATGTAPYASLLVGNDTLGFYPVFPATVANGFGSATPPTTLTTMGTLASLFPAFTGFVGGETLEFRVNDHNNYDNSGGFLLTATGVTAVSPTGEEGPTAVPEPSTLLLFGTGLAAVAYRHRRRQGATPDRKWTAAKATRS